MGKIIITGPGRSGTTFLLQIFTRLGFDTGYTPETETYGKTVRAGCEWQIGFENDQSTEAIRAAIDQAPRVMKSPEWGLLMKEFCRRGVLEVDHCYIPVRDLDIAAKSRIDAGLHWQVCETDDYDYLVMDQASVHALALGRAIEACLMCDIPYTILLFPQLVTDMAYCYNKLCEGVYVDQGSFNAVFQELANPKQIKWRSDGEANTEVD